jgi:hypothetical protein
MVEISKWLFWVVILVGMWRIEIRVSVVHLHHRQSTAWIDWAIPAGAVSNILVRRSLPSKWFSSRWRDIVEGLRETHSVMWTLALGSSQLVLVALPGSGGVLRSRGRGHRRTVSNRSAHAPKFRPSGLPRH